MAKLTVVKKEVAEAPAPAEAAEVVATAPRVWNKKCAICHRMLPDDEKHFRLSTKTGRLVTTCVRCETKYNKGRNDTPKRRGAAKSAKKKPERSAAAKARPSALSSLTRIPIDADAAPEACGPVKTEYVVQRQDPDGWRDVAVRTTDKYLATVWLKALMERDGTRGTAYRLAWVVTTTRYGVEAV